MKILIMNSRIKQNKITYNERYICDDINIYSFLGYRILISINSYDNINEIKVIYYTRY